jgi:cobalt-zinc-cadmium resistance protein CzcA
VRVDPENLVRNGLTFDQVYESLAKTNRNVGGGHLRQGSEMLIVQGLGRLATIRQIEEVVILAREGVPVRVGDVAEVAIGHRVRIGAVTADGHGEAILGLGFLLLGENSRDVSQALRDRLNQIRANLPPGVQVEAVYARTDLVDQVIDTVRSNLLEAGLFVVAVLFLFLGGIRAAMIVALAIPLSMLVAFGGMWRFGIAASLLSLGAIDFGMVVDSSVVLVENCVRRLARDPHRRRYDIIRDAALEVRRPTLFGEMIIMIVYLPILTLEGVEGKMFRPMALTVIFALAGSMLLSVTLMPVLASFVLSRHGLDREPAIMRLAHRLHAPLLRFAMNQKVAVIVVALTALIFAFGWVAPNLGTEFVPRLSEGSLGIGVVRLAGTDLEESIRLNTLMEKALLAKFSSEIEHVWSRVGTAEIATDPMGVELTDLYVTLTPRDRWENKGETQAELTERIERLLREMPGQKLEFSQPIEMRMNELTSGVRADVAVKVFGDDLDTLVATAKAVERVLTDIPGAADVVAEQVTGQPLLQIRVKRDETARYGVTGRSVLDLVESVAGKAVGEIIEGPARVPLVIRLPSIRRDAVQALAALLITTPSGEQIPLNRLATVEMTDGPSTVTREWGQRLVTVQANVRGRDLGSFVAEAQRRIRQEVSLPAGRYRIEWGGQFEHLLRARQRLILVVPVTLALIFAMLYVTYGSMLDSLRVFSGLPFAAVGGIIALWLRDMPFSISAGIGFIALSGVAVLDDMILVSTIRQYRRQGMSLDQAVTRAAITRLRPVLMTSLVASLGFLPMAVSTGVGAEVQRPLATVVIGGVLGALVTSLLVVRVLYLVIRSPFDPHDSHEIKSDTSAIL